jgi:hypothetical protein
MPNWTGYIMFEVINLNQANFDDLCDAFAALPPDNPLIPRDIMRERARLDGLARVFEMKFDSTQVSLDAFKQFMADLFGVPVEDVVDSIHDTLSYSGEGRETRIWSYEYPAATERLQVSRFGRGASWDDSRAEGDAYITANNAAWDDTD